MPALPPRALPMASTDPRLIQAVQELDSGTRALLDLSLRRAISDEKVAGALGVEIAEIPRRRARGIAELADKLAVPGPAELALLLVALPDLPEEAWGVPNPSLPKVTKVSKTRRVRALRRVAVAASPLVAAAAVMAALIVSSGSGDKHVQISATSALGGKQHQPAASAKAPRSHVEARHAGDGSRHHRLGAGPHTRGLAQRILRRADAPPARPPPSPRAPPRQAPQGGAEDGTAVDRPLRVLGPASHAYVPPPKPVKQRKQHPRHHTTRSPRPPPSPLLSPSPPPRSRTTRPPPRCPPRSRSSLSPRRSRSRRFPTCTWATTRRTRSPTGRATAAAQADRATTEQLAVRRSAPDGPLSDGSQSDKQSQADYRKAPDPKSLMGIFEKHRGGDYNS